MIADSSEELNARPRTLRVAGFLLLLFIGWLDAITGPEVTFAPFYILVLIAFSFYERWSICLIYSGFAALISLGADLRWNPAGTKLIYPYWRAFAHLLSFALISSTISLLAEERRRLRLLEEAFQKRTRRLERALEKLKQLRAGMIEAERRAEMAEVLWAATDEIEKPLASISIYADELSRWIPKDSEARPLLEKLKEKIIDIEVILKDIRSLGRGESREAE